MHTGANDSPLVDSLIDGSLVSTHNLSARLSPMRESMDVQDDLEVSIAYHPGVQAPDKCRARTMTNLFIRQRQWCDCGRSCNAATGKFEAALSAYECGPGGPGRWLPTGQAWQKWGTAALNDPSPWFLVEGEDLVGNGGDGEPLLRSLKLEHHLEWSKAGRFFEEVAQGPSPNKNHDNFPDCRCEGGADLYKKVQDHMYGDEEDEEDEEG